MYFVKFFVICTCLFLLASNYFFVGGNVGGHVTAQESHGV